MNSELIEKIFSIISTSNSYRQYMLLPCDLTIKGIEEWITEYTGKYEVGKEITKSQVIAYGEVAREVWNKKDLFNGYYFVDGDIAEDETTITADVEKYYYIDQTDDSINYKDMNALYNACMSVISDIDDSNFEYRMRNGLEDKEKEMLLSAKSISENLRFE